MKFKITIMLILSLAYYNSTLWPMKPDNVIAELNIRLSDLENNPNNRDKIKALIERLNDLPEEIIHPDIKKIYGRFLNIMVHLEGHLYRDLQKNVTCFFEKNEALNEKYETLKKIAQIANQKESMLPEPEVPGSLPRGSWNSVKNYLPSPKQAAIGAASLGVAGLGYVLYKGPQNPDQLLDLARSFRQQGLRKTWQNLPSLRNWR